MLLLQATSSKVAALAARFMAASMSAPVLVDHSRPWLGPPSHSHRVKAKRRALRMRGGR